jgi:RNA polymerase-binding transcription factor DksA
MRHGFGARCAQPSSRAGTEQAPFRGLLLDHRRSRLDQLTALTVYVDADTELDAATRARTIVIARKALKDIDAGLSRLEDGTYGRCTRCLAPIPIHQLLEIPQIRHCLRCTAVD